MNDVYSPNRALSGGGGNIGTTAPAAPQPLQSAALFNGMMERISRLNNLAESLEMLADRVVGPVPAEPKASGGAANAIPGYLAARLDVCVDSLDVVGGRITNALVRLERFV